MALTHTLVHRRGALAVRGGEERADLARRAAGLVLVLAHRTDDATVEGGVIRATVRARHCNTHTGAQQFTDRPINVAYVQLKPQK